jgi:hypothetical protein
VGERASDETFDLGPVVRTDTWIDRISKVLKTLDILAYHRILFHVLHIGVLPCIGSCRITAFAMINPTAQAR